MTTKFTTSGDPKDMNVLEEYIVTQLTLLYVFAESEVVGSCHDMLSEVAVGRAEGDHEDDSKNGPWSWDEAYPPADPRTHLQVVD